MNNILIESVKSAYTVIYESNNPDKHGLFFSFIESIATDDTVNDLIPIVEGYCATYGILTEGWQDFARKHGNKVKAFMAGLMLLASVANAGTNQHVKTGDIHIKASPQTEMSSTNSDGNADATNLLKLLANDSTTKDQLAKAFNHMKSHAKDPGYIDDVKQTLDKAGVDGIDRIFDNGDSPKHDSKAEAIKSLLDGSIQSNDEQVVRNMANSALQKAGFTDADLGKKYSLDVSENHGIYTAKIVTK